MIRKFSTRSLPVVAVATLLVVLAIVGGNLLFLRTTREAALKTAEEGLDRDAQVKALQADASFKSVDLVLSSIGDYIGRKDVTDGASYERVMSEQDTHYLLKEKIAGLPQIDAITLINAKGKLINFSRYWPIPNVNIADRDYFKALSANPNMETFISVPVQNRGDGKWNIYVARRLNDPNGEFMGLVLGALSVQYFENFYATTSIGDGSTTSLDREDGQMLARYPRGGANPGATRSDFGSRALSLGGVYRDVVGRGKTFLRAARALPNYPIVIVVSREESHALVGWRAMADLLIGMAGVSALLIIIAATAVAIWWRRQEIMIEKIGAAKEAAQAANRAKSTFLATMSHEIRTPMNAVLGLTSVLLETHLEEDQRRSLNSIREAGDNLLDILNDILDFSKLETGQFNLEQIAFSPQALIETVRSTISPRAAAKGLAFEIACDENLPPAVEGDPGRIRQVMLNLASNAVKFTAAGSVVISAREISRDADHVTMEWSVSDTGIGIEADKIGNLFQEFVQADSSINRRFGGSGLGLSICKRLVDRMGGEIKAASVVGEGSTFSFHLTAPIAKTPAEPQIEDVASSERLNLVAATLGRPINVLIVDDNATNRLVACRMLGEFNMGFAQACDGAEAVEITGKQLFDVVLMDLQMPHMDGLQATRIIRKREDEFGRAPIIAMTANAYEDDVAASRQAGMNAFVAKPIRKKLLVDALAAVLSKSVSGPSGDSTPDQAPPAERLHDDEHPALLDAGAYARLVEEIDADTAKELFDSFVGESTVRLPTLPQLAQDGQRASVKREAHSLKSTAGTFGFVEMAKLARQIEVDALDLDLDELLDRLGQLQTCFTQTLEEFMRVKSASSKEEAA